MLPEYRITAGFMPLDRQPVAGGGQGARICRRRGGRPRAGRGKARGPTSATAWRWAISTWRTCWPRCRSPRRSASRPIAVPDDRADGARVRRQRRDGEPRPVERMAAAGAPHDLNPGPSGGRSRAVVEAPKRGCASASFTRIRGTITSCATGSPRRASTPTARSRSSCCRRR